MDDKVTATNEPQEKARLQLVNRSRQGTFLVSRLRRLPHASSHTPPHAHARASTRPDHATRPSYPRQGTLRGSKNFRTDIFFFRSKVDQPNLNFIHPYRHRQASFHTLHLLVHAGDSPHWSPPTA